MLSYTKSNCYNVGRYTKTAYEQKSAFTVAKSIWDEAALGLIVA
jgi:hypothetical protein